MTKREIRTLSNARLISLFSYNMCRETKKAYLEQKECLNEMCRREIITEKDIKDVFVEFV